MNYKVTNLGDGCELYEWEDGDKEWHQNGVRHRVDGPAVERASGNKAWFLNDKLHRVDGPAVEYTSGTKHWWIKGKQLTEEEFKAHPAHQSYLFDREVERVLNESN